MSIYPFPAPLIPLPLTSITTEGITGYTNEAAKDANKAPINPASCFFISCFTVSVASSTSTTESSSDFMILIIPFMYSLEIKKVKLFPPLTAPFPLIFFFFSNLFIVFVAKLLTNPGELSLAKEIVTT